MKFPNKKYNIIYADPPWKYDSSRSLADKSTLSKSENYHYPAMSLDELKQLPIRDIANENCILFMWATGPKLDWCFPLGVEWGFEYSTIGFVWDKVNINPGSYTLSSVEICLIFKKGKIPTPRGTRNERQFLQELKTKHSKKPQEFRHRIDRMFPTQSKIELFARQKTPGWDVWGNEV